MFTKYESFIFFLITYFYLKITNRTLLLYLTGFIIIDRDSHFQLFPLESPRGEGKGGVKLFENICEFRYRTIGSGAKVIGGYHTSPLSLSHPLTPLAFINLLPPTCSSVLNYLLTPANLLAAELWSALNELLREHHKLKYSALSARARDVGQRVLTGTRD